MANIEPHTAPSRSRYYAREPKVIDESVALQKVESKVTNGRHVSAVGGDGRCKWTRRWKDIVRRHLGDLGGASLLSEAQISMVRRANSMTVVLEAMEIRMSQGDETVPLNVYCMVSSEMRRLFECIGTVRVARDISGEVEEYFEPRRPTTDRRRKDHRP